jgi:Xaa-Pro dipeptidase
VARLNDCVAAMAPAGFDALVLGRDAHVRTITGEARLWLAGTRPFTPSCIVVRATGAATVPPLTWNPANLAQMLLAIPGFTGARRIGVDGMTPAARSLLQSVVPDASVADATPLLRELVRVKTAGEIDELRAAAAVARDAFAQTAAGLQPGVTTAQLRGRFAEAAAAHGVTTPAFEAVATTAFDARWWSTPGPLDVEHASVVLRAGVLRDGWEASLARTYRAGRAVNPPGWDAVVGACRPGERVGDLFIVNGVGRGREPLEEDVVLEPGMVVAVELDAGRALREDVVLIGADGPEILTEG